MISVLQTLVNDMFWSGVGSSVLATVFVLVLYLIFTSPKVKCSKLLAIDRYGCLTFVVTNKSFLPAQGISVKLYWAQVNGRDVILDPIELYQSNIPF